MNKNIAKRIFKIIGWEIRGDMPVDVKKAIFIYAPHTSYVDFYIGFFVFAIFNIKMKFLIKKEAFRNGIGPILRALGGMPVDRGSAANVVDTIAKQFKESDSLYILICPEGTRKATAKWKRGFYYIALKANLPIIICFTDYKTKKGGILDVFYPTGDIDADWQVIRKYYVGRVGKRADQFILPEKI